MGFGAFINIVLDPILMIVMGEYAIEGAAIATVTAQIIQAILTIYYFRNKSENVKIGKIRKEKRDIKRNVWDWFFRYDNASFLYSSTNIAL